MGAEIPNTLVLDFPSATITIKDDGTDTRPPWTRAHMEKPFSSPLFHPELLRLGFADYVRAIQAEGDKALFPEL